MLVSQGWREREDGIAEIIDHGNTFRRPRRGESSSVRHYTAVVVRFMRSIWAQQLRAVQTYFNVTDELRVVFGCFNRLLPGGQLIWSVINIPCFCGGILSQQGITFIPVYANEELFAPCSTHARGVSGHQQRASGFLA